MGCYDGAAVYPEIEKYRTKKVMEPVNPDQPAWARLPLPPIECYFCQKLLQWEERKDGDFAHCDSCDQTYRGSPYSETEFEVKLLIKPQDQMKWLKEVFDSKKESQDG
jgi:hypothetical protein